MLSKAAGRAGPRRKAEEQSRVCGPDQGAGRSDDRMDMVEGAGAMGLHL